MFFCIGAQKAGTTWLYEYLSQSENVHFCANKELHYFNVRAGYAQEALKLRIDIVKKISERMDPSNGSLPPNQIARLQEALDLLRIYSGKGKGPNRHKPYLDYLLKGRANQPVVADITPGYAVMNREGFADMASVGKARFMFIMRDPVSRMWSQIRMAVKVQNRDETDREKLASACQERADMLMNSGRLKNIERADYARTITELEAAVPPDRIKYIFYENLFGGGAPQEILDFLEIPEIPFNASKRVNEGMNLPIPDETADKFRAAFDKQYKFMRERFGDTLPAGWRT
ncbi:sulfotransferase [Roseovarius sp. MMSF_3281]|uniref:sulfotransferase n=1 Tax=Roseovarius sp. MMSF_3281 TaxID=3046694 RepID=UPI00273D0D93|nr:sulfotransferase [Roseovarius sp. MMSF_3281]